MIDVTHQLNEVRREVGTRVLEAGEARIVTIGQTYAADVEDVWDACTDAERIPRWFLPVTGELKVGGRYQLEGNAGGVVEACEPPRSFRATWEYGGEVSWIEVTLTPQDGGTRFELRHIAHVDDERWAEFGPGAVGIGWDMAVVGLTLHLSSGEAVDPAEAMAWSTSPEGLRFMTGSNQAWCEAAIAGGTPEAQARAAAERTIAAYTATE
ncbi:SRPBCC family protein [Actinocorallia populi]|uniref:SRPBCC family protein n=1 Tax=Actinocorallia populi TaxID=2079200 RepID=UPI000D090710|nr:SRPBCC family protein [Actinocorallia populi]